jgi:hypothetical protein
MPKLPSTDRDLSAVATEVYETMKAWAEAQGYDVEQVAAPDTFTIKLHDTEDDYKCMAEIKKFNNKNAWVSGPFPRWPTVYVRITPSRTLVSVRSHMTDLAQSTKKAVDYATLQSAVSLQIKDVQDRLSDMASALSPIHAELYALAQHETFTVSHNGSKSSLFFQGRQGSPGVYIDVEEAKTPEGGLNILRVTYEPETPLTAASLDTLLNTFPVLFIPLSPKDTK